MKYAKPEVAVLASALDAIRSGSPLKPTPHVTIDADKQETDGAYEADD
jgi:hypothetical protein